MEKPWISESTDVDDCSSCKDDDSCGNTITVNIDLSNVRIADFLLSGSNCWFIFFADLGWEI